MHENIYNEQRNWLKYTRFSMNWLIQYYITNTYFVHVLLTKNTCTQNNECEFTCPFKHFDQKTLNFREDFSELLERSLP